jgi:hypothetical protein
MAIRSLPGRGAAGGIVVVAAADVAIAAAGADDADDARDGTFAGDASLLAAPKRPIVTCT